MKLLQLGKWSLGKIVDRLQYAKKRSIIVAIRRFLKNQTKTLKIVLRLIYPSCREEKKKLKDKTRRLGAKPLTVNT